MTEIGMIDITDKPFVQREAEAEGITSQEIIKKILDTLEINS